MIYSLLISLALIAAAWYFKLPIIDITLSTNAVSIVSTIVQVAAIMIGFLITAYSILIAVSDKPIIRNMNITGHFSYLLRRLFFAALLFGMNLLFGLYILLIQSPTQAMFVIFLSLLLISFIMFISAARYFFILISNI